jgi:tetratricopeptide (TPR) repeat protein
MRRRDHIRGLLADADNPGHEHARRVMESYETEWLADQPILLAILHCVGLFDRPASGDCLKALRARPAIRGLSEALVGLSNEQWRRAVERLREVRLLAPADPSDREALDAHPLVREWFSERAWLMNEAAWRAAHSRLYDHLRRSTCEGQTPTLADLAPLYHAVVHGCRAGRHQDALAEVYKNRICRGTLDGGLAYYSNNVLGAFASDLAAVFWFFDQRYEAPVGALAPQDRAWILFEAGTKLRAQGRLQEALPALRVGLLMQEEAGDWANAAIAAATLSQTELLFGDLTSAAATAEKSVMLADRTGDVALMVFFRTTLACVLHGAGYWDKARDLFSDAERRQREAPRGHHLLYSVRGYNYCDLLLSHDRPASARDRAEQTIEISQTNNWLLDIALDTLMLGRAHLALALLRVAGVAADDSAPPDTVRFDKAVEGLRTSGQNDEFPRGLVARAAFRRAIGDWNGAKRDLNEAKEIAEPGEMRLYLCDCALEEARLALARREAFAPLNRLVEPSPTPPTLPDAAAAAVLKGEALKQLDIGRKLIAECGYHRRDGELAELDAAIAGRRRFADLPPRV